MLFILKMLYEYKIQKAIKHNNSVAAIFTFVSLLTLFVPKNILQTVNIKDTIIKMNMVVVLTLTIIRLIHTMDKMLMLMLTIHQHKQKK